MDNVHFSSGKDNWETPDDLFQRYNATYNFILDAAADATNHKVDVWFGPGGVSESALDIDWTTYLDRGSIWLNPPYSRKLQTLFVRKALQARIFQRAGFNNVVCLLPARTDTKLFHEIIKPNAVSVEFLKGRIKFVGASHGAPFPSMIVIF